MEGVRINLDKDVFHAAIILITFALLGTQNAVHYPFALMSAIGLWLIVKNPSVIYEKDSRNFFYVFALVWSPMLFSLLGAIDLASAGKTTFSYLHFLFGGYYVYWAAHREKTYRLVGAGVFALVFFALSDALIQFIFAVDLFGFPYDGATLKGLFYPKERLGMFLAVLSPLILYVISTKRYKIFFYVAAISLIVFILLLCVKRSAWVMFGLSMLGFSYLIWMNYGTTKKFVAMGFSVLAAFTLSFAVVMYTPTYKNEVTLSSGFSSGEMQKIDIASNYRLSLWRTGLSMFLSEPVNGIGPRGYRHVYAEYADPTDFWLRDGENGQTHPHLQLLEIAVETGFVGLTGFLLVYLFFLREIFRETKISMKAVWILAVLVAWFPLNTHLAFYGSYWASFVWLLIPLALAQPNVGLSKKKGFNLGKGYSEG
ncbi:MAG: O-antigen ligase family protein [Proteobacteria bacterium]|nr:O-antigen ligase family protein [Pseudomonadota bacterium]MBT5064903.1 O-antigen ligase family protein [Pseudomonadota bacterium]MBT6193438.1 O-antigen ligase family protein [Pseudomonadota bacterium]MBT7626828.1 O-antigen ligase family protein [Pseudomonadota bacterium]